MAKDVMVKEDPCNSCCQVWKKKCTKLEKECSEYKKTVPLIKKLTSVVDKHEKKIQNLEAENLALQKERDHEKVRAESEKRDKEKESDKCGFLENQVSAMKFEILSLQQKNEGLVNGGDQEVTNLQRRISETEKEVNELKELLQKERKIAAEEREKFETERKEAAKALEKVKADKKKAVEEKRLNDIQRKNEEETRLQLKALKCEVDDAKSKLILEKTKCEDVMKKLRAEIEISKKERERADREMAKVEELLKLSKVNLKKVVDERNRADNLSQQLDESKKRLEKLENERLELVSTQKLFGNSAPQPTQVGKSELCGELHSGMTSRETGAIMAGKKHENLEKELRKVKKQLKSEMKKAEEQMSIAKAYKSKALEEKIHGDRLSCELEGYKQKLEKIQNEIQNIVSSMTGFKSFDPESDGSTQQATAEIKFLRKQLKFEKARVKLANKVYKMEMTRKYMLRQEVHCMKQEFLQCLQCFDTLDKCLFVKSDGANHMEKIGNLEQEGFRVQPSLIPHTENALVKPSCTSNITRGVSASVKQNKISALLPTSLTGEICSLPITGTDSSSELLLRGSSRKMLETSAINSSSASFSDKQLVGSQERGTFSVSTSALLAEKQNLELSDNARKACEERLGVGPEKSVGSPLKNGATESSGRHQKKKRKLPVAMESIEHLHYAGQRWHQQVLQKLSVMHGMLAGVSLKSSEEEKLLPSKIQDDADRELFRSHKKQRISNIDSEVHASDPKKNLQALGNEVTEVCKNSLTTEFNTNASELTDICDGVLGTKWNSAKESEVSGHNYMKLFDLDDENDEQRFREAIKKPISPLSPALSKLHLPFIGAAKVKITEDNVISSRTFDVISMEIDSNERTLGSHGSCKILSFGVCKPDNDPSKNSNLSGKGVSCVTSIGFPGQSQNSTMPLVAPGDKSLTCAVPVLRRSPQYCVVLSSSTERSSIYRIFHACSEFIFEISGSCLIERLIKNILLSLQKADGLSSRERGSVLLSLLLQYVPEIATDDSRSVSNLDSPQFMDCFSQQWRAAMNDLDTKRMFAEFSNVSELLALLEDFLLNRTVLVYGDVSHEMMHGRDLGAKTAREDECILWSSSEASANSLIAGGLVLASICVSVDQIGFICEISYHLFSARKNDISFSLKLLHLFAHLCGSKYFTLEDYSLEMSVLKSLVVFLENLDSSSSENFSYSASAVVMMKISACAVCPFSQDVASVDFIVSLLLGKLQSFASSGTGKQDTCQPQLSSMNVPVLHRMTTTDISCHREIDQLSFVSNEQLCSFVDILSLVELFGRFMTWDWTFGNIVSPLFKILDFCTPGNLLTAVIALLSQLGRIGIDAKGYEDSQVGMVRNWLVGFVCRDTFKSYGLSIQFVSMAALMGLVGQPFDQVINTSTDDSLLMTDSQSAAVACVSKWFSSLSKEEQSSFGSLQSRVAV